ncbi:hypothetical protein AGMMS49975_09970 [Clostridia bacterium]|nr:hypothetical protein AGMMS49975_09970 [Clostridia bacterium]
MRHTKTVCENIIIFAEAVYTTVATQLVEDLKIRYKRHPYLRTPMENQLMLNTYELTAIFTESGFVVEKNVSDNAKAIFD